MNKPLTVSHDEFVKNLVDMINQSGLPFFIIRDVLQSVQKEIGVLAQQQLEKDRENYQKSLNDNN